MNLLRRLSELLQGGRWNNVDANLHWVGALSCVRVNKTKESKDSLQQTYRVDHIKRVDLAIVL